MFPRFHFSHFLFLLIIVATTIYFLSIPRLPEGRPMLEKSSGNRAVISTSSMKNASMNLEPLILYYNPVSHFLGKHMLNPVPGCSKLCKYSEDTSLLDRASAIVVHLPYSSEEIRRIPKKPNQLTVTFSMESECAFPGFVDAATASDLEMSYRLKADVWTPYFSNRIPFQQAPQPKTELVAAFISNCSPSNRRQHFLEELLRYLPLHSYGACNHNVKGRSGEVMDVIKSYKFYLAFENCNIKDYVTEKIFRALRVGSVPVYMGAPNIYDFVPTNKSIINTADFTNAKELADFLLALDKNETAYQEYLQWKTQPQTWSPRFRELLNKTAIDARCRLCEQVHLRIMKQ